MLPEMCEMGDQAAKWLVYLPTGGVGIALCDHHHRSAKFPDGWIDIPVSPNVKYLPPMTLTGDVPLVEKYPIPDPEVTIMWQMAQKGML